MKVKQLFKTMVLLLTIGIFAGASCCGQNCKAQEKNKQKNKEVKSMVQHLTKSEFLTKIANYETSPKEWKFLGNKPAIVDFYATWCGPCKAVAPILEELATEYEGKIDIYKIDTDKEQELSSVFGIRSIPSILFIPMEGQPQMVQGALPKTQFKELIEKVLLKEKEK